MAYESTTLPIAPQPNLTVTPVAKPSVSEVFANAGFAPLPATPAPVVKNVAPSSNNTPANVGLTPPPKFNQPTPAPAPASTPAPAAAPAPYNATVNPDVSGVNDATAARTAAYSLSNNPTSEDRANALSMFQGEIDALNSVYADQKRAESLAGANRVGSNTAIEARRGLLGSDFGTAGANAVVAANTEAQNAIDNKHNLDIQGVYGKIATAAAAAATNRVSAAQKGADALLEEKKSRISSAKDAVTASVKDYLAAGNDGSKLTTQDAQNIVDTYKAKGINISIGDVTEAVKAAVTASTEAKAKQAKEAADLAHTVAETANVAKPASVQEYEYAKANGYKGTYSQYQNDDANRKIAIAHASQASQTDKKLQGVTVLQSKLVPGAVLPSGETIMNPDGNYINPAALTKILDNSSSINLTPEEVLSNVGGKLYIDPKTDKPSANYKLTPKQLKDLGY